MLAQQLPVGAGFKPAQGGERRPYCLAGSRNMLARMRKATLLQSDKCFNALAQFAVRLADLGMSRQARLDEPHNIAVQDRVHVARFHARTQIFNHPVGM